MAIAKLSLHCILKSKLFERSIMLRLSLFPPLLALSELNIACFNLPALYLFSFHVYLVIRGNYKRLFYTFSLGIPSFLLLHFQEEENSYQVMLVLLFFLHNKCIKT